MSTGISTNRNCESSATALKAAGLDFVFRYHSLRTKMPQKRLSPLEAATLARAGLQLATVYQDNARLETDFGAARGREDAIAALTYAGQVGQPPGSAVYFAVDVDFSLKQLAAVVKPYFDAVVRTFADAGNGTPYLRVGVYGSGLTCRLVRQHVPGVSLTWLAEATAWRESSVYDGWNVRQRVNTGKALGPLGTAYEDCDGRDDFGQFQPVGFALTAGQGTPMRVVAGGGNIRWLPTTAFGDPIALLPPGQVVNVLGASAPGWVRVRGADGANVIGHMALSRLAAMGVPVPAPAAAPSPSPLPAPAPPPAPAPALPALPPARMRENNPKATRQSTTAYPFPIGEAGRPTRDPAAPAAQRVQQLRALADWLDVERSARYLPGGGKTFCNIYAADYLYLAGVYLPRVWWTGPALLRFGQGQAVDVVYGDTVSEILADQLLEWLLRFGPGFGWRRVFDASALQAAANAGGVGVICADAAVVGRHGHITVVVPEDATHSAVRDADGHVLQPLQSQAGSRNFRYGSAGPSWWQSTHYRDRGFFVHD